MPGSYLTSMRVSEQGAPMRMSPDFSQDLHHYSAYVQFTDSFNVSAVAETGQSVGIEFVEESVPIASHSSLNAMRTCWVGT